MLLPTKAGGLSSAGTFWFFAVITVIGFFWAWLFIPETSGMGLESIDKLFTLRWWQIGRMGRKMANEEEQRAIERTLQEKEGAVSEVHVETSEKRDSRV